MPYANNKGTDQAAHPHILISAFVVRYLDSIITKVTVYTKPSLWSPSEAEQTGLSLTWSHNPKDRFSREVAPFWLSGPFKHDNNNMTLASL